MSKRKKTEEPLVSKLPSLLIKFYQAFWKEMLKRFLLILFSKSKTINWSNAEFHAKAKELISGKVFPVSRFIGRKTRKFSYRQVLKPHRLLSPGKCDSRSLKVWLLWIKNRSEQSWYILKVSAERCFTGVGDTFFSPPPYYCFYSIISLIKKDHLGDLSPEKDCCLWLMFQQLCGSHPQSQVIALVSWKLKTLVSDLIGQ